MTPSSATPDSPLAVVQPWRHPLSRWYLLPVVLPVARLLVCWGVPPAGITLLGAALTAAGFAGVVLGWWGLAGAAVCFWGAWCCDRLDGTVARLGSRSSPGGARLDACCDEAADLLAHLALAVAAHRAGWPLAAWGLLAVFAGCKGVFLWWSHFSWKQSPSGDAHQEALSCGEPTACAGASTPDRNESDTQRQNQRAAGFSQRRIKAQLVYPALPGLKPGARLWPGLLRRLYHLGGNADLRWHLVWAAMLMGQPLAALGYGAGYFALRVLVGRAKRLRRASALRTFLARFGGPLPVQATRGTTP